MKKAMVITVECDPAGKFAGDAVEYKKVENDVWRFTAILGGKRVFTRVVDTGVNGVCNAVKYARENFNVNVRMEVATA